ncbi:hypothetical protein BASA61_010300 [Batrachochytrium salamandrivorans]|nr:hypothetical protein BASA60_009808 [Batrachochytrium salamandrivorans]KAH6579374.1 hypothetical protein BASA61_010300 [Batrachochytrium salamandrivorans]KAH9273732.1 phosphatidylserine decarboxylase [Batrachochytrium salamandrivorans]KAJ1339030.1 phosphatidylserine decarboxylase [Batrachochytrium salamandrivorans]
MRATTLKCKVLCARNLLAKDRSGTSDPYVVVKLGDQLQKTPVISRSLNPVWNTEMVFTITPAHVQASLQFTVWDKDFIGRDFLGQLSIPINTMINFIGSYDDPNNTGMWHILNPRKSNEAVKGDIMIRIGIDGELDDDIKAIFKQHAPKSWDCATLVSSDDPADDLYFNHFTQPQADITPEAINTVAPSAAESSPSLAESLDKVSLDHSELLGLLTLEIVGARNLPFEASRIRSFNCDPFAVISFGKRTFRTKVVRNSLSPDWNQRVFLHVKSHEVKADWTVFMYIYDYEDFASNTCIGSAELRVKQLVEDASLSSVLVPDQSAQPLVEMTLPIKVKKRMLGQADPTALVKVGFMPYTSIRGNFFRALLNNFGSSSSETIDKVALVTLLDNIGSTYSDATVDSLFHDVGKTPTDTLSFDEAVSQLEMRLHPEQLIEDAETEDTALAIHGIRAGERMADIKICPICQKELTHTADLDCISHVALCSHVDFGKINNFVLGGLVTHSHASRKWYTKIVSYVTFGEYGVGKNNGNILYQDRATGQLCEEKMPTYIRLGIRLLYQSKGSQSRTETSSIRNLLKRLSVKQGEKFDSPESTSHIASFVAFHNLDLDEVCDPTDSFKSFNEFFYRKLKASARVLASSDPRIVVSPADARTNVFPTIHAATQLWIKGTKFSTSALLDSPEDGKRFEQGSLAIFRLAPQDYHRFHFPVDGVVRDTKYIDGTLFTVNPMAIRSAIDVYTENVRSITYIDSTHFGRVAYICVGAMLVGSIVVTSKAGQEVKRMDEHGYFKFGGSTIILLFENNMMEFDQDLLGNSGQSLETLLKFGESIGTAK